MSYCTYCASDVPPEIGTLSENPQITVWELNAADDIYTGKKYMAELQWSRNEAEMPCFASITAEYLSRQAQCSGEAELWNIWMGCDETPLIKKSFVECPALCAGDIERLLKNDPYQQDAFGLKRQYCLTVIR